MIEFRELSDCDQDIEALRRFHEGIYLSEFPNADERESLPNMVEYLQRKADGWYGPNNYHIMLGLRDGEPVAGGIADYLAEPNAGVIEFLAVARDLRGGGIGRELLGRVESLVIEDARAAHGREIDAIVAEINDPFKINPEDDSLDPFLRATIWAKWGYRKLDFPYLQPALSAQQAPVHGLALIAKSFRLYYAADLPGEVVKSILRNYLRWAMRIDDPEHSPEYWRMAQHIGAAAAVPLVSLSTYVGEDATRPLAVREVEGAADPDVDATLAVYAASFPGGPTHVDPDIFRNSLAAREAKEVHHRYHLWAIRAGPDSPVEGMASFFTFPSAGFGGYVTLAGSLRGSGRARLLLGLIEQRMVRDGLGARGWYIECDPHEEPLFAHFGFRTLDLTYRQPPLPGGPVYAVKEAPPLCLMHKDFGRNFEAPVVGSAEFLAAMRDVFRVVYRIEDVLRSPFYADLRKQTQRWPAGEVSYRATVSSST